MHLADTGFDLQIILPLAGFYPVGGGWVGGGEFEDATATILEVEEIDYSSDEDIDT